MAFLKSNVDDLDVYRISLKFMRIKCFYLCFPLQIFFLAKVFFIILKKPLTNFFGAHLFTIIIINIVEILFDLVAQEAQISFMNRLDW